jgi:hypothetical protein
VPVRVVPALPVIDGVQDIFFKGYLSGRMTSADLALIRCGSTPGGAFLLSLQGSIGSDIVQLIISADGYHGPATYADERLFAALWSPPATTREGVWRRRVLADPASFSVNAGERSGSLRIQLTSAAVSGTNPVLASGRWSCPAQGGSGPPVTPPSGARL